jgi:hypothetical protein
MTALFNILLGLNTVVAGLSLLSIASGLLGGSRMKPGEYAAAALLCFFFAATSYWAYRLKQNGAQTTALIILAIVWALVLVALIVAASKARWN